MPPHNIVVVGDIILDHNIYCKFNKIANEKPIPVFLYEKEEFKLGGAGNVLNNLDSFGCEKLFILSKIGNDLNGTIIEDTVSKIKNISSYLYKSENYITTTKKRYFSNNDLLFRIDNENSLQNSDEDDIYFINTFNTIIEQNNITVVVLSDYAKGMLSPTLCIKIIDLCNLHNIITIVDPKDDLNKFKGCTLIKPNRAEAQKFINMSINLDNIIDIHKQLINKIECKYSLITLSEEGLTLYTDEQLINVNYETKQVFDVTGAGDVITAVVAYFICNTDIEDVCKYANYLATKSVEYIGVYKLSKIDIIDARNYFNNTKQIFINELNIIPRKKIVFTNGCFDLLHSGHINTLKFAKKQGDILVVGVNSDTSVRKLKGENRPIHNQDTRIHLLSNIHFIDYIIMFDEDTPLEIIKTLKPNILVKGGDYTIDTIIGKEYVDNIILAPFKSGVSTTNTIKKILN